MERNWTRALITGASSGIGREMAQRLMGAGTELVVVARDRGRLEQLAATSPVPVEVLPADLSKPGDLAAVADRLADDEAPIDLLVNNAGLGFTGAFIDVAPERKRLTVDVNVVALHDLCDAGARAMVGRGGGTILNVSSVAGDLPGVASATYSATKAFVTSLSQSMAVELKDKGVVVSCLCPGLTRTEFQDRAEADVSRVPDIFWQSAADVARAGLNGAAAGRPVIIPGPLNRMASRLSRSAPRAVSHWTAEQLGR